MEYNNMLLVFILCFVIAFGFFISIYLTKGDSMLASLDRYSNVTKNESTMKAEP
jgi:hypothetical protein